MIAFVIIVVISLFVVREIKWGTLIGVLFLGCISNGMTLLNVIEYWHYVLRVVIILVAVLLNQVLERLIPTRIDQNSSAQDRLPMDRMRQG